MLAVILLQHDKTHIIVDQSIPALSKSESCYGYCIRSSVPNWFVVELTIDCYGYWIRSSVPNEFVISLEFVIIYVMIQLMCFVLHCLFLLIKMLNLYNIYCVNYVVALYR